LFSSIIGFILGRPTLGTIRSHIARAEDHKQAHLDALYDAEDAVHAHNETQAQSIMALANVIVSKQNAIDVANSHLTEIQAAQEAVA
jgi:hypothetical protein